MSLSLSVGRCSGGSIVVSSCECNGRECLVCCVSKQASEARVCGKCSVVGVVSALPYAVVNVLS